MEPGTCLTGKKKCPADSYSTDGIKLVRIIENFCLKGLGDFITPIPVRLNAMRNFIDAGWCKIKFYQDFPGNFCAFFCMADFPCSLVS